MPGPFPDRLRLPLDFDPARLAADMAAGSYWYLRLSDPHSVANRGSTDRVHLIIDATVNARLTDLFDRAAVLSA